MGLRVLRAPFIWFGGKSVMSPWLWQCFGPKVKNYVEPFAGTLAVLLQRPEAHGNELVNDADGLLCNFWRAVKHAPDEVAEYAEWPRIENDVHARHAWLVGRKDTMQAKLEGDPEWYDTKAAGWWVWGLCCWMGGNWCAGNGPWRIVRDKNGVSLLVRKTDKQIEAGVNRTIMHLGGGRGVNKRGINRRGNHDRILNQMRALSERLRYVRVCCGDWTRVCGGKEGKAIKTMLLGGGRCAVFLDPPYSREVRGGGCYRVEKSITSDVRDWAIEHGKDKRFRIALCGYEGEHKMPSKWRCLEWKASGGYGNIGENGKDGSRERIWLSPHCLKTTYQGFNLV